MKKLIVTKRDTVLVKCCLSAFSHWRAQSYTTIPGVVLAYDINLNDSENNYYSKGIRVGSIVYFEKMYGSLIESKGMGWYGILLKVDAYYITMVENED